ncbi:MAG: hypothetical protein CVU52_01620 [Deltaproteobacteria bacterium HGW-Deltaproteobacteria-10]|nr:MAG: hypothetical protein CVU52_01620 [Deltaproteobacteria bacterium HGW-Deltaproteobacteria-10]
MKQLVNKIKVFVDFDGTITTTDVGEAMFIKFGNEEKNIRIIKDWISKEIGSSEMWQQLCDTIDFFNEHEALVNEMTREFPEDALEIKAFYESALNKCKIFTEWLHNHPYIKPLSFKDYYIFLKMLPSLLRHQLEKTKYKKLLNKNISLKKVFEAQEALLSINIANQNSFSSSFQHCTPFRGIYSFRQGKQILFNSLIKKLESKNGLYLSNCEVLNVNKGKSISIDISANSGNTSNISAKYLIVSTKWDSMHLLLAGKKKINFEDWIRPAKISHLPFTIHLGCARKCLPEKMAHHLAVVSDVQKSIFDNNMIILEYSMPDDEMLSADINVPLTATVFLSTDSDQWSYENMTSAASSIIDRLEHFLPFLKENIVYFDLDKSIELSKKSHCVYNPKYIMRRSFITGFAARTNKTRFKNVYLTGASLLSDAGFEGEIISGINAASRVISKKD